MWWYGGGGGGGGGLGFGDLVCMGYIFLKPITVIDSVIYNLLLA